MVRAERASRGAWWRDPERLTLGLVPVAVPVLAWWGWRSGDHWAWVALSFYTMMVGCRATELRRLRSADGRSQRLIAAIRVERDLANRLRPLQEQGWTVLFDRALPVSATRVSHLLIGRAGVIVVAVAVPATNRSEGAPDRYVTSGLPDADDIGRLAGMLAAELGQLHLPVLQISVLADGTTSAKRWDATSGSCPLDRLVAHLRSLPRALPEQANTLVAAVVDDLCPPIVRPTAGTSAPLRL